MRTSSFLLAVGTGIGLGAVLGTLAAVVILFVVVLTAAATSVSPGARRQLARSKVRRARLARREVREERLVDAGASPGPLLALTQVVDELDRADGGHATDRHRVEELLDRYTTLAVWCHQIESSRDPGERIVLAGTMELVKDDDPCGALRRECLALHLEYLDAASERLARWRAEMAAIEDFTRMLRQRAALPPASEPDAELRARVEEVRQADAAWAELP